MSFRCHTCRDTGRVTERGRFYGDRDITGTCPDCQVRMTQAEWEAEIARLYSPHAHAEATPTTDPEEIEQ